MKRNARGFTLLELLVTTVLIGTIFLIAFTLVLKQGHVSREATFSSRDLRDATHFSGALRDDARRSVSATVTPQSATFVFADRSQATYSLAEDGVLLRTPSSGEPARGPHARTVAFERDNALVRARWVIGSGATAGRLIAVDVRVPDGAEGAAP